MHRYYTCCEQLDDSAIEEILPEAEGVPEGLNFQDAPESPAQKSLSLTQIVDWLRECRHECEPAQLLLNLWLEGPSASQRIVFFERILSIGQIRRQLYAFRIGPALSPH